MDEGKNSPILADKSYIPDLKMSLKETTLSGVNYLHYEKLGNICKFSSDILKEIQP